jgi:DNA repair protein RecN (Recombination protein N)
MLTELHIENMGIIADLTLRFGPGLTALTGETGAGKTMLIEAINLLLGDRADTTVVRDGADEAHIEGRFVVGDEEIILARTVPTDGRSRAYINGRLATATLLAEQGSSLVDLHGQHSHQSLLSVGPQRAALDTYAGVDLGELTDIRKRRAALVADLNGIGGDERTRARELDLLRFQLDEIETAQLTDPDEEQRLDTEEEVLAGAVAHTEAAEGALTLLSGDDGTLDQLRAGYALLSARAPFAAAAERLKSAAADLDDLVTDLRTTAEHIEENPERLAEVRARRQKLRDLCRKYGDNLADVMAEQTKLTARCDELVSHDERVVELQRAIDAETEHEAKAAAKVAAKRRKAAPGLGTAVQNHLRQLALPKAQLEVQVDGDGPADDVSILFQANPGEAMHPLAKVASGGELARTMLALRLVLTGAPETLVFDEVDAGIGGEAALAVGRSLAQLGRNHQVFVVTHLAQVAAFADQQIVVTKQTVAKRTITGAGVVTGEERTRELSRMLSGLTESDSANRHAEELLDSAKAARRR